jgi:hypothetical protein
MQSSHGRTEGVLARQKIGMFEEVLGERRRLARSRARRPRRTIDRRASMLVPARSLPEKRHRL